MNKNIIFRCILLGAFFLLSLTAFAQNGKIVSSKNFDWRDYPNLVSRIEQNGKGKKHLTYLNEVEMEEIFYLSDGLKVKGFLIHPKKPGNYPCVIYNRGGNREFGKITPRKVVFILARIASWGYTVVASQYRGNDGGEGREEFGGADVNDILNLIPLLANDAKADTSRMGIYGWSRGGMMTYLTLTRTNQFKAAIVGGGVSDLRMVMDTRQDTFETVYLENIPNYEQNKAKALNERSAILQVENFPKTTPILMMHGTADWRVVPQMALELSMTFIKHKIPHRLVLFEGGDHGLSEHWREVDDLARKWLDDYVRDGKELPELIPHGR